MADNISYARVKSDAEAASSYSQRKERKHQQEMSMVSAAMDKLENTMTVLDAPCGVGRVSIWLASKGYHVTGVDLGNAALILARQLARDAGVEATFESQDLFKLPYQDRRYDATLCFRLLHHFESPAVREQLIAEICRVSDQYLLISRITPTSVTSLRRVLRLWLTGKPIKQYPVTAKALDATLAAYGFESVARIGRFPLFHSLQLHVYRRK